MRYKIVHIGDSGINDVHHIGVEHDGTYYSVIFGRYENGGFLSIPNMGIGSELAGFEDVLWNAGALGRTLKRKSATEAIVNAIADYAQYLRYKEVQDGSI